MHFPRPVVTALITIVFVAAPLSIALAASGWTSWQSIGSQVSVRYTKLSIRDNGVAQWTWSFRNDGATKIRSMSFQYVEQKATGQKASTDYLPFSLKPGEVHGGWASYIGTSPSPPTITIITIDRGNGAGSSSGQSAVHAGSTTEAAAQSGGNGEAARRRIDDARSAEERRTEQRRADAEQKRLGDARQQGQLAAHQRIASDRQATEAQAEANRRSAAAAAAYTARIAEIDARRSAQVREANAHIAAAQSITTTGQALSDAVGEIMRQRMEKDKRDREIAEAREELRAAEADAREERHQALLERMRAAERASLASSSRATPASPEAASSVLSSRTMPTTAKGLADAALDAIKARNSDLAIALSQRAVAMQPSVNNFYVGGVAYANAKRYPEAIAGLEQAKRLAITGHADQSTMNGVDSALISSYLFGGQAQKGLALAKEFIRRDPSNIQIGSAVSAYYVEQANAALRRGNAQEAAAAFEDGAKLVPSRAVTLYLQAAQVLSLGDKANWGAVKAAADKAIAIDINNARANYIAGMAAKNLGDDRGAATYLIKAKANGASDSELLQLIEDALQKLGRN